MKIESSLTLACCEIYQNTPKDLLDPSSRPLPVREDAKKGPFLEGIHKVNMKDSLFLSLFFSLSLSLFFFSLSLSLSLLSLSLFFFSLWDMLLAPVPPGKMSKLYLSQAKYQNFTCFPSWV
jgi:hypothetical protein